MLLTSGGASFLHIQGRPTHGPLGWDTVVIDMDTLISSADLLSTSLALYSSFYFLDVQDRSSHLLQKQFYALFHTGIKDNKKKDYHNSHFAKQKQNVLAA